jgi:DNA-directed RNA polymerase subunit delta
MGDKMKSLAMLDVAEILLKESTKPLTIQEIIKGVAEIKEISLEDIDRMTQLYMDITQSAKFVYCGDDQWDLKERNLELWDKDGFAFVHAEEA